MLPSTPTGSASSPEHRDQRLELSPVTGIKASETWHGVDINDSQLSFLIYHQSTLYGAPGADQMALGISLSEVFSLKYASTGLAVAMRDGAYCIA